ncbi:TRAP transporter small permease [Salipiger abyssi]|uniref:TRAP transporter small permease n=1 Tax=Salipiger abyssi TaxID=1250539 RepID=UPI001A8F1787|nr:TRAP transporter small permease subunit [Salipiger abyssi]MBN9885857.1 TRAP transporter small permease [Salipiger abyssi]
MRKHFRTVVSLLDVLEAGACFAGLVTILALISANVFMRYVMGAPLAWTHEVVMYLFTISSLMGISTAYRRQRHLQLQGLLTFLPAPGARIVRIAVFFALLALLLFLASKAWDLNQLYSRFKSPLNRMPRSILSTGLLWALGSMALSTLYFIVELLAEGRIRRIDILERMGIAGDLSRMKGPDAHPDEAMEAES